MEAVSSLQHEIKKVPHRDRARRDSHYLTVASPLAQMNQELGTSVGFFTQEKHQKVLKSYRRKNADGIRTGGQDTWDQHGGGNEGDKLILQGEKGWGEQDQAINTRKVPTLMKGGISHSLRGWEGKARA